MNKAKPRLRLRLHGYAAYEIGDPLDNDFARAHEAAAERFSSKSE